MREVGVIERPANPRITVVSRTTNNLNSRICLVRVAYMQFMQTCMLENYTVYACCSRRACLK